MARKVNYSKKIEKIKDLLDELVPVIDNTSEDVEEVEETTKKKFKITDIDFESEDVATLMKIQSRLVRTISRKMKQ